MSTKIELPEPEYGYYPILSITSGGATIYKHVKRNEKVIVVPMLLKHDETLLPTKKALSG